MRRPIPKAHMHIHRPTFTHSAEPHMCVRCTSPDHLRLAPHSRYKNTDPCAPPGGWLSTPAKSPRPSVVSCETCFFDIFHARTHPAHPHPQTPGPLPPTHKHPHPHPPLHPNPHHTNRALSHTLRTLPARHSSKSTFPRPMISAQTHKPMMTNSYLVEHLQTTEASGWAGRFWEVQTEISRPLPPHSTPPHFTSHASFYPHVPLCSIHFVSMSSRTSNPRRTKPPSARASFSPCFFVSRRPHPLPSLSSLSRSPPIRRTNSMKSLLMDSYHKWTSTTSWPGLVRRSS